MASVHGGVVQGLAAGGIGAAIVVGTGDSIRLDNECRAQNPSPAFAARSQLSFAAKLNPWHPTNVAAVNEGVKEGPCIRQDLVLR